MILTFKVKHGLQLDPSLFEKAIKVAQFACEHKGEGMSSATVKQFGLHSHISNQLVKKYGKNKTIKRVNPKSVKLIVPGQDVRFDCSTHLIRVRGIACLNNPFKFWFRDDFIKVNQLQFDKTWAWVSVTVHDIEVVKHEQFIGIDLNSTSHSVVIANPSTGKIKKLGKQIPHLKRSRRNMRSRLQKQGRFKEVKRVSKREHDITQDLLHKITTSIVREAKENNTGIKIEDLKGIRKRCSQKYRKEMNFILNSWPFYMFKCMLTYKCKKLGVELVVIDPKWTSQRCSLCGNVDKRNRNGKSFCCTACGHVDHADVNAAFNIANTPEKSQCIGRSRGERVSREGNVASRMGNRKKVTNPKF
jgi:putative transposase